MGKHGIGKVATTIATDDNGLIAVTYHTTKVVRFDASRIILRTGGHYTVTTKRRMNEASKQFQLEYQVYQVNFGWFVSWRGKEYSFWDDMILDRSSGIVYRPPEGKKWNFLTDDEAMMIVNPLPRAA